MRRTWKTGDRLQITIPMTVRAEAMPDARNKLAFVYGPSCWRAIWARCRKKDRCLTPSEQWDNFNKATADVPILVSATNDAAKRIKRVSRNDLVFRTNAAEIKT